LSRADLDYVKVVISQGQNCLIYIEIGEKSRKLSTKSELSHTQY